MPGDPKECRQHALNCVHLAKGASTPEQRDHFAKLARTWIKLAEELEQTEVFLRRLRTTSQPSRSATVALIVQRKSWLSFSHKASLRRQHLPRPEARSRGPSGAAKWLNQAFLITMGC